MADKSLSPSHATLLNSREWQHIQSLRRRYGLTAKSLAWIAPQVGKLLRKWERQLPEGHQLPEDLRDLRDLVLAGRTFERTRGQLAMYGPEKVGQYMHQLLGPLEGQRWERGVVLAAAEKAHKKFGCAHSSAMKWYYAWRKTHSG